jgi:prepilin peptidase CpaA
LQHEILNISGIQILPSVLLVLMVLIAAYSDYRWKRIPNIITLPSIAAGLLIHGIQGGWSGLYFSLAGLILGAGLFVIFYLLGGIGAGDVKLMGAIGSFLGAEQILIVFLLTGLVGGLMSLYKIVMNHSIKQAKSRLARLNIRKGLFNPLTDTIPYGVAIAIGTLLTLTFNSYLF